MTVRFRKCKFRTWKRGAEVDAHFFGAMTFARPKVHPLMEPSRIFAVDTESLTSHGKLKTVLTPIHYNDSSTVIETLDGRGMLEKLFESIFEQGWQIKYKDCSQETNQRRKRIRNEKKRSGSRFRRDGRRLTIPPVLSVWFNLPYDFGRLCSDRMHVMKSVCAGADAYAVDIGSRFNLEIIKMHFGAASSFDWLIRDKHNNTIVRLLGIDLTGYWKTYLGTAAKSVGVSEKIDIESQIENVYEKPLEKFTEEEWRLLKEYSIQDSITTLELYHATAKLLTTIDARVVKQTGVIPASAPGAAAKIVFAKAFDCHPEIEEWKRYPVFADALGCRSYYGGRVFCVRPGVHKRMTTIDLKSAYPFQTALMPDPVTVIMQPVSEQYFNLEKWKGQYGVLVISGESTDDLYPAFRVHDPHHSGRLQYVYGPFEKIEVTIPEIVIGVLRGILRVDKIHSGVHMIGKAEGSFLRKGMLEFFAIKEDEKNEKALQTMAKLLANSTYGKLVEVQCSEYMVNEKTIIPAYVRRPMLTKSAASVFANGKADEETYFGDTEEIENSAHVFFDSLMLDCPTDPNARGSFALECYVQTLATLPLGVEQDANAMSLERFVSGFQRYKCGQYFMPVYAAQITGATSAMVGLMAECTDAFQGDTDSVHVQLPEGVSCVAEMPNYPRYFRIMQEARYPSPFKENGVYYGGIYENRLLGSWDEESTTPSIESLLVRPKVYSHVFPEGALDNKGKKLQCKQATHGFSKFYSLEAGLADKNTALSKEDRKKKANAIKKAQIHEHMRTIISGKTSKYITKSAPRKLRESVRSGKEVGEFISREVILGQVEDPNTWTDENGYVRWLPLMATRQAREEQEAAE